MSGDSTFGISNTEAALSSSNDPDEADESVDDLSQKTSSQSDLSAAEVAKWRADNEKRVNNLLATLWDGSLDQSVPEWTGNSRVSRWRQRRNQDDGGAARSSEHFNVSENDSIDAVEEEIRSRRRPFSNGQRRKSSAADVAAAYNDNTTDDENVYKKPLPFAQRRKKSSVPDPNAFNETHSSVEEERPVRRTRGGFSKRPKSIPNPEFFDSATMDESVVVEAKPKRFTRSARQVTEANMKAFEVSDDEEEDVGEEREKETRGGEDEREKETRGGEDEREKETREGEDEREKETSEGEDEREKETREGEDEREKETRGGEDDKEGNGATETRGGGEDREGKGTTEEDKGKENTELEEGSELEEEGSVDKAGEETRNSMDESDESEAEEGGGNKSVSLVIQSEGEVGGEDSLDEDVDEEDKGEEKEVVGRAKSGVKGDQNKLQQKNLEVGGSSNEQSSLLLEYHLSTENQSVSHNKSSASLKSSASMTMDITLASRRSRSRRFTQQRLEMDKTGEGEPNLGKILDGLDVMNMSANNLLEPIEGEVLRISPLKEVAVSDRNDRSLRSRNNSAVSENNNISLRSRDDSGVSDRNNRSLRSGNKSNSGVSNENNKSLRSGNKPMVEKELNSSGKSGKKRSSVAKELFSDSSSGKDTSGNNLDGSQKLLDGSVQPLDQQDDGEVDRSERDVGANRSSANSQTERNVDEELKNGDGDLMNMSLASLRDRMRGEADKSKVEDNGSKENGQRGEDVNVSQVEGSKESSKGGDDIVNDTQRGERRRGKRGREYVNKSVTPEEQNENRGDVSMDVINDSQRDEGGVGNRSLRNRRGRGDANKSVTEKDSSKENVEIGDVSRRGRGDANKSVAEKDSEKENVENGDVSRRGRGDANKSVAETDSIKEKVENGDVSRRGRGDANKSVAETDRTKENVENGDVSRRGRGDANKSVAETDSTKEKMGNSDVSWRGRGDANKSVAEKDSIKENVESNDVYMEVDNDNSKLDGVDGANRGLRDRSAAKRLLNTSVNEEQTLKQRGKSAIDREGSKENGGDVPNTSLRESSGRSLRNRSRTKGKSNESLNKDQSLDDSMNFSVHDSLGFVTNAKKRASLNVSKGDLSIEDDTDSPIGVSSRSLRDRSRNSNDKVSQGSADSDDVRRMERSSNGVRTYTSEEIVGFKQATQENSLMYNSLDSIRVDPLQLPQTDVNASAIVNNSLNSTRADQNSSNRGLDEIMPAPRSLPARKRRLVAPTGGTPSFSLAAQKKKKKTAEGESDSIAALVEREKENNQVAVNGNREVVAAKVNYKCPKLKKPEVWVTPRLYKWLIEKLEPRYKLRSRLRAEEFVDLLCSTVKTVIKKEENYEKEVEDLKYEMARLNMVENLHEFFIFIYEYLPWRFQDKSIPLPQSFITGKVVTYEKGTLYDPIL